MPHAVSSVLRRYIFSTIALLWFSASFAQLVVTPQVQPPYSPDLNVWTGNPNRVVLLVINTDGTRGYDFRFSGSAKNQSGSLAMETRDDVPVQALHIDAGQTKQFNLNDFKIFQVGFVKFTGTDASTIARTKLLPDGIYTLCVKALDYRTTARLSSDGCANFSILTVEPPRILQPTCGATVDAHDQQSLNINWSFEPGTPGTAQYTLQMIELVSGQSVNDAFRTRRGAMFFERSNLRGTSFLYGPSEPRLRRGQRYGLRIQASDPSNTASYKNEGYSAACEFTYGQTIVAPPPDTTPIPPPPPPPPPPSDEVVINDIKTDIITLDPGIGCITMSPVTTENAGSYTFGVSIDPAINVDAITGGTFEAFRTKSNASRQVNKVIVRGWDPKQKAFERSFKGHSTSDIRMVRSAAGETMLELPFVSGFQPEKNTDYEWHLILNFDGKTIRKDGVKCVASLAHSEWGVFPDLGIKKKLPDTLICGTFTIVVEDYDSKYQSIDPTRPSGTGCIKFDCKKKKLPPWIWGDLLTKPKYLDVIGATKVSDASNQITLSDALTIDPTSYSGGKIAVDLPVRDNIADVIKDIDTYLDFHKKYLPDCFRVRFRDVRWAGPIKRSVTLTEGYAWYPADPIHPTPPALLTLDSGFTLAIDSLILTPAEATVQGKVLLPKNVISADTCTRAFVYLPKTTITASCEFYKEVLDSSYGRWWVGNTGLSVYGNGYVVDFSSTQSYAGVAPPLGASWKGIVLRNGETPLHPGGEVISNRGWIKAQYTYAHAFVRSNGFQGTLTKTAPTFIFKTLEPFGNRVRLNAGKVSLAASAVTGGEFLNGYIDLPQLSIRKENGALISLVYDTLQIQPDEDLWGRVRTTASLTWGEFNKTTGTPRYYTLDDDGEIKGYFYLAARALTPYYPADSVWHQPTFSTPETQLEAQRMQGATLIPISSRKFTIWTVDVQGAPPKKFEFEKAVVGAAWVNVMRTGPHAEVYIFKDSTKLEGKKLGDPDYDKYQGAVPFTINFGVGEGTFSGPGSSTPTATTHVPDNKKRKQWVRFQFVESAVWDSELSGDITFPMPMNNRVAFKRMMFTSTADCAGGQLDLSKPDSLAYWGVDLVAKDTAKSAGVVCVRLGVVYLTAAGIAEPKHYAKPFWLTWGEIKADGNWGRLFFDYNSVGQRFDGFAFSPSLVKLSDYAGATPDSAMDGMSKVGNLFGYLHAAGTIQFPFFGAKYMSLSDYLMDNAGYPYESRYVRLRQAAHLGAGPSEVNWERSWAGSVANFVFTSITYDSAMQFGFLGSGTSALNAIGGTLDARITIHPDRSCFSLMYEGQRGINLAIVANFSMMEKIWGCGCIVDGTLERVVVGAEISTGGGVGASILARAGSLLAIKMSFTPSQQRVNLHGSMYVVIASAVNADVLGFAEFVADWGSGYVEGYLRGELTLSGPIFTGGVNASGELQWHFGIDYNGIQGRVAIGIYGPVSLGMEAGIFLGVNFPKSKIWVTDGIDGRFAFNKGALPSNVTGTYAYISISQSVNLYIVSGGYQVFVGVGAFMGYGPEWPGSLGFGVIGNVGVRIWGEILGGLVSASAWGQLSMVLGVPPAFEGVIGLEACVLWVFCGSVSVHCGYNASDGFYLY
jgi:hypothetical protein